jgi:hypothetical protein
MSEQDALPPQKTRTDRLRSAALTFITMTIVNSFFAIMSLGALKAPPEARAATDGLRRYLLENPLVGTAFFSALSVLAIMAGLALTREKRWGFVLGKLLAAIHIALILLVTELGGFVIVHLVLGIMAMTNLHLADAFEEAADDRP